MHQSDVVFEVMLANSCQNFFEETELIQNIGLAKNVEIDKQSGLIKYKKLDDTTTSQKLNEKAVLICGCIDDSIYNSFDEIKIPKKRGRKKKEVNGTIS